MNKLHLSEEVQNDLLEIKTYIEEELLNPSAALATVMKITKSEIILQKNASFAIFDCRYREQLSIYCKRQLHQLLPCLRQRSLH